MISEFKLSETLNKILATGNAIDLDGKIMKVRGGVSKQEAIMLMKMVVYAKAKTTLETGVAFGISTLAICDALRNVNGETAMHYGVDPNQFSDYNGSALASLKEEGLDDIFTLLEGPSHLMLPELIKKKVQLDCAFIDGWHTFDYTLLDFFLIDKLLKPGGYIAFHDMYGLSKQKVVKFIRTHRKYKIMKDFKVRGGEPYLVTIKFFVWRLIKYPSLIFSWFHWNYQLQHSSGLLILKKLENYEPPFSYYKSF